MKKKEEVFFFTTGFWERGTFSFKSFVAHSGGIRDLLDYRAT